jgi:guanine deaminase
VQALAGERRSAWCALHAATLGPAAALGLSEEIGSLSTGCAADLCVWDWSAGPVARRRHDLARSLHEQVFAWMTLSDERNLVMAMVNGVMRHERHG